MMKLHWAMIAILLSLLILAGAGYGCGCDDDDDDDDDDDNDDDAESDDDNTADDDDGAAGNDFEGCGDPVADVWADGDIYCDGNCAGSITFTAVSKEHIAGSFVMDVDPSGGSGDDMHIEASFDQEVTATTEMNGTCTGTGTITLSGTLNGTPYNDTFTRCALLYLNEDGCPQNFSFGDDVTLNAPGPVVMGFGITPFQGAVVPGTYDFAGTSD